MPHLTDGVERTLCAILGAVPLDGGVGADASGEQRFCPPSEPYPGWFLGMMDGLFRTDGLARRVGQSLGVGRSHRDLPGLDFLLHVPTFL